MTLFTLHHISYLGFIMIIVIVISFGRERKLYLIDYTTELLTRIVQSLTKQNDKMQLMKND